ncbi:MAG: hypothetical protein FWB88_10160 [Defluviitaleaceae bacterium]|nr:hypothetical protein [Defluviitaleaceae bacterium]MCL2239861.1 hypothetical protein [Defluviitaleaceae bacterium]
MRIFLFRLLLLAAAVVLYFTDGGALCFLAPFRWGLGGALLWVVWLYLVGEMLLRLFPNNIIPMGARKHFSRAFLPAPDGGNGAINKAALRRRLNKGALLSFLVWLAASALLLWGLYALGRLTPGAVFIFMLSYAVLDITFVLFRCPFQRLFMGNHCCTSCRIYNWDYLMMCAALVLFPGFYSLSLVVLSLAVFLRWEIAFYKNPHFFLRETNLNLTCEHCGKGQCKSKELVCQNPS